MGGLNYGVNVVLDILQALVITNVLMSWLINFQVLNIRQPQVAKVNYWLHRALEPIYGTIRRFLPPMSGLDFTPLVVLVAIAIVKHLVPGPGLF
jgi:YggT family protein